MALSIDRWEAVVKPLAFTRNRSRGNQLVLGSWLLAIFSALPATYFVNIQEVDGLPQCNIDLCSFGWRVYTVYLFCLLLAVPALIIAVCYTHIVYTIWSKGKQVAKQQRRQRQQQRQLQQRQLQQFFAPPSSYDDASTVSAVADSTSRVEFDTGSTQVKAPPRHCKQSSISSLTCQDSTTEFATTMDSITENSQEAASNGPIQHRHHTLPRRQSNSDMFIEGEQLQLRAVGRRQVSLAGSGCIKRQWRESGASSAASSRPSMSHGCLSRADAYAVVAADMRPSGSEYRRAGLIVSPNKC